MVKLVRRIRSKLRFYKIYFSNVLKKRFLQEPDFGALFFECSKTLAYRYCNDLKPFLQYIHMLNIIEQKKELERGLEIGGGYSTVLLSKLAIERGCEITVIDINPDKYKSILPSKKNRDKLFASVNFIEDLTVDFNTLTKYFQIELQQKLSKYNPYELKSAVKGFIKEGTNNYTSDDISLSDVFDGNKVCFYEKILTDDVLNREKSFYASFDKIERKGYLDYVIKSNIMYDFIFFDCGELSSLVEWETLENHIKIGGYAILHDIYFPKSIKNFLVASLITISKNWEVVYKDSSTPQGLLIAKKLF